MWASVRAELLTLGRRRAAWALVLVIPVLTLISGYVLPYVQYRTVTPDQYSFYGSPEQILPTILPEQAVIVAVGQFGFQGAAPFAVLGALIAGGGWATGTLTTALLQRPGRVATLAGQAGALLVAVVAAVVATFAVSVVSSVLVAVVETGTVSPDLGPLPAVGVVARAVGAGVLVAVTSGAAGLLLGTLLRNPGGAIAAVLLWTVFVQSLLDYLGLQVGGVLQAINNALPNANAVSVTDVFGAVGGGPDTEMGFRVEPARAVWVLVFYVVAFFALSAVVLVRRDINGGGGRPGRGSVAPVPVPPRSTAGRPGLLAAVKAELLVTIRRPTVWALAAAVPAYALLSGYGLPYLFYATAGSGTLSGLAPSLILPTLLPDHFVATVMGTLGLNQGLGVDSTAPFLIIGGLLAGGEWERGTIRTALLQGPGRLTTLAGQVIALGMVLVAAIGATFLLCSGGSGLVALAESGSPFASSEAGLFPEAPLVAGAVASAVLIGAAYGAIGLALGTVFRNASGPIAVALLWAVIVQPQLATLAGQVGGVVKTINDALPSGDVLALVTVFAPLGPLMGNPTGPPGDPVTAAWSLLCYLALALALPALLLRRRDVT